jgi:hypothetical protein
MSWDVQVPFLSEMSFDVFHCLVCRRLFFFDDYIDLANTYLFVEAQIMNDNNIALDGGADVGSVNLWMHSLFSDVSVSLNENLVSPPASLYPYLTK